MKIINEEIKYVTDILKNKGISYKDEYSSCISRSLAKKDPVFLYEMSKLYDDRFKINSYPPISKKNNNKTEPLYNIELFDHKNRKHMCRFREYGIYDIDCNNKDYSYFFDSDGEIVFSSLDNEDIQNENVSYSIYSNSNNDNFNVIVNVRKINEKIRKFIEPENFELKKDGDIIEYTNNRLKVIESTNDNYKLVRVTRKTDSSLKFGDVTIVLETIVDDNYNVLKGICSIVLQDIKSKVKGQYCFSIDTNDNVHAIYINSKNKKHNLIENPDLFNDVSHVIYNLNPDNISDSIILDFIDSIKKVSKETMLDGEKIEYAKNQILDRVEDVDYTLLPQKSLIDLQLFLANIEKEQDNTYILKKESNN